MTVGGRHLEHRAQRHNYIAGTQDLHLPGCGVGMGKFHCIEAGSAPVFNGHHRLICSGLRQLDDVRSASAFRMHAHLSADTAHSQRITRFGSCDGDAESTAGVAHVEEDQTGGLAGFGLIGRIPRHQAQHPG